jgi:hypothetical protein
MDVELKVGDKVQLRYSAFYQFVREGTRTFWPPELYALISGGEIEQIWLEHGNMVAKVKFDTLFRNDKSKVAPITISTGYLRKVRSVVDATDSD